MADLVLFAGTTEGRQLAELARELGISTICCVATEYGGSLVEPGGSLDVRAGRLDAEAIKALLRAECPRLVLDATHPYADHISRTLTTVSFAVSK